MDRRCKVLLSVVSAIATVQIGYYWKLGTCHLQHSKQNKYQSGMLDGIHDLIAALNVSGLFLIDFLDWVAWFFLCLSLKIAYPFSTPSMNCWKHLSWSAKNSLFLKLFLKGDNRITICRVFLQSEALHFLQNVGNSEVKGNFSHLNK